MTATARRQLVAALAGVVIMLTILTVIPVVVSADPIPYPTVDEVLSRRSTPTPISPVPATQGTETPTPEPSSRNPMTYHGGTVMRSVQAFTVFWAPPLSSWAAPADPADPDPLAPYQSLMNQYFMDIGGSDFYGINTQYYSGGDTTRTYMENVSTFGGTWIDRTPYPDGRGTPADPLLGTDIEASIARALAANPSWGSPNATRGYFLSLPEGVAECTTAIAGGHCSPGVTNLAGRTTHCAYHSVGGSTVQSAIYAVIPYLSGSRCVAFSSSPNYSVSADAAVSASSHEHFEVATDPDTLRGWFDTDPSGENGDKCSYIFSSSTHSWISGGPNPHVTGKASGSDYGNITLNGHRYLIQLEWSNANHWGEEFSGCTDGSPAHAHLTSPAKDAVTGDTVNFTWSAGTGVVQYYLEVVDSDTSWFAGYVSG